MAAALALTGLGAVATSQTQAAAAPAVVASLAVGRGAFWSAGASGSRPSSDCDGCVEYPIQVAGGGTALRVAVEGDGWSSFSVDLVGPDGTSAGGTSYESYAEELTAAQPAAGTWRVVVGSTGPYRLRAVLDRDPAPHKGAPRALLPDIALVPPYDLSFSGLLPNGCSPYEMAEYRPTRCLRFATGPVNAGAGPLVLAFQPFADATSARVTQRIQRTDGTWEERAGGTFEFHPSHAHFHHQGFGDFEVLRVVDERRGTLAKAASGPKAGFCMLDIVLARWRSFANAPAGSTRQDCSIASVPGMETQLGLSTGWGDIYTSGTDGNYVDFGNNPDGRYVMRSTADAGDDVAELDETNNSAYSYFEVTGSTIRVIERGYGLSPWDRAKVRADDLLRPSDNPGVSERVWWPRGLGDDPRQTLEEPTRVSPTPAPRPAQASPAQPRPAQARPAGGHR